MLGRTHATTGALAVTAATATHLFGFSPAPGAELLDVLLFAGAALLPDLDCDHSQASLELREELGFLSLAFLKLIELLSGGHRHGTHSIVGIGVFTAFDVAGSRAAAHLPGAWGHHAPQVLLGFYIALMIGAALRALRLSSHAHDFAGIAAAAAIVLTGYDLSILPWAIAIGATVHVLGDMITEGECPIFWPFTKRHFGLPLFRVGGLAEGFILVLATLGTLALLGVQLGSQAVSYLHAGA